MLPSHIFGDYFISHETRIPIHQPPVRNSHRRYKVGPKTAVVNIELCNPYKWPKINGFHWGYFIPIRSISGGTWAPTKVTGDGAHLVESCIL